MAQITNGTPVSTPITPGLDDQNTFPTHLAKYGEGGFEIRENIADIRTISAERRTNKLCLSLADGKFYVYKTAVSDWVEYEISGSGGGLTWDQIKTLLGITEEPDKLSFSREIYAPKFSTAPSTITIGNLEISGGNGTLSVLNLTNNQRAIAIGLEYKTDGTTSLRSYSLTALEWHDRQMNSSEVQPTDDYEFKFKIPDNIIRAALEVIPSEPGELSIESYDLQGHAVAETQVVTITSGMVNQPTVVTFKNQAAFYVGEDMMFNVKGVRLKGKSLPNPYDGALTFYPYFRAQEYIILERPQIADSGNIIDLHAESVELMEPTDIITIPSTISNVVLKYRSNVSKLITQTLPDLEKVLPGTRIFVENTSKKVITLQAAVGQTIEGISSYQIVKNEGIQLIADKHSNRWLRIGGYVGKEIKAILMFNGGSASSTMVAGLDGGHADSTFTRTVDAGGA